MTASSLPCPSSLSNHCPDPLQEEICLAHPAINGTHAYPTRQIGLFFSANADEVPIQVVNNKIGKGVLVARGNIILKRYPLVT